MGFKPNYEEYKPNRDSIRGAHIEDIIDRNNFEKIKIEERKKFGPETERRKNFNSRIVELMMQGWLQAWPTEEITARLKIEFPEEDEARIENITNYWMSKFNKTKKSIDSIMERYERNEISKEEVEASIKLLKSNYTGNNNFLASTIIREYYKKKKEELEAEK